jgi:polysaccharide pyruvyl transferase WcaK-like protein/SAM-dependent methyltransferase
VIVPKSTVKRERAAAPRVGLFGHLGACNIGNDASMEAVLRYFGANYPGAVIDAMCPGPERVRDQYGIGAVRMVWYQKYEHRASGGTAVALKVLGKGIDVARTAFWVRRHDVVIVPGAGVLEASLPLWPWGMPYAMFLLSGFGRLFGTKVAFVSVGAGAINKRATRWLSNTAARLAYYRSYRDAGAREALRRRGVDTSRDHVYTDLAFALPAPPDDPGDPDLVAVGVMEYRGSNDERGQADEIYSGYVGAMKQFVRWLVDNGRSVRLFVGDTNGSDDVVVQEILTDLKESRPGLDPSRVVAEPTVSFADVMRDMSSCGSVVAIRYHNLIAALKVSKPTISISYSPKHDVLIEEFGLAGFSQPVNTLNVGRLIEQFTELGRRSDELRQALKERNTANSELLDAQFAELSAVLFHNDSPSCFPQEMAMNVPVGGNDIVSAENAGSPTRLFSRDFWSEENLKFSEPWYRIEKSARLIRRLAGNEDCSLLDIGCGPTPLMRLLPSNIQYYGIDIAIQEPAPNLIESDILKNPIKFGDKRFDIIIAQGVFEYLDGSQHQKFAEIADILNEDGIFIVSYTNFRHRKPVIYHAFSNVMPLDEFRSDLARYFHIRKCFPFSHNWKHGQPARKLVKAVNMHVSANIPFISPVLAVEYFFVCSPRRPGKPGTQPR